MRRRRRAHNVATVDMQRNTARERPPAGLPVIERLVLVDDPALEQPRAFLEALRTALGSSSPSVVSASRT